MTYDKINFKDKTDSQAGTPLDASNMNHMEDGIAANADDITKNTADISALNNDLANSDVLGMDGTALNSGDDLNNCLDSEKYYSNSAAISRSLSNAPVANAFSLFIVNLQRAGSRKMQIVLDGASNNIFFRSVTPSTSTWTSWEQVSTTTVTTTSISAPTSSFIDENGNVVEG